MENTKKIKVALVRGNSLNEWEGRLWEKIDPRFEIHGLCSRKNLYPTSSLSFPVDRVVSSTDYKIKNGYSQYFRGRFQDMKGLENRLVEYDIVHTAEIYYWYTFQATRAKQVNKKLKILTTVWDNSFGRFEYGYWGKIGTPEFWRKKMNSLIQDNAKYVDVFLPVTEYSREMLISYGVAEDKIKILTPALFEGKKKISKLFESKPFKGKKIVMMVNRMVKEKGVYDVLYGWNLFIKKNNKHDTVLVCVGSGKEKNNMVRLVRKLGLEQVVFFLEHIGNDELRSLYSQAHCLVLGSLVTPLWQEQFGYVLAESINEGCPVISTYSGAIPEVVGSAGILVPPGNPPAIATALESMEDENVHLYLKKECKKESEKFSHTKFAQDVSKLYLDLIT